ncbi:MAG: flavodoxin-dependent (E)-4-hydroxy-3-methylbut-2-enyl-diphosphate synthase [Candidatus Omnitrophica bacterium]|nr:flavodoxin-dependent (E)-4-hydroxy-3-methylbut-2-enyl-diphosphate synthase [Candidatus Omnitrophota bacterium]
MPKILRRKTPSVAVGNVLLGSAHSIAVQSMTDTPTADVEATLRQTVELIEAGSEMVRWTINDDAAALGAVQAIRHLRSHGVLTPIIGDFHFNGHTLLEKHQELAELLDKYRINPGNVGRGARKDDNFASIVKTAIRFKKAVRIGVNWGSLDREVLAAVMDDNAKSRSPKAVKEVMYQAVIESALESCHYAEELGLSKDKLVVSAKLSDVQDTIEVYERLSRMCDYVLHVGLTEAGGGIKGVSSSAAALAILLQQGIGDTIRISLTPEPGVARAREVEACQALLQGMGFRYFIPSVVSCPGCGRTKSAYFQELARDIRTHIALKMAEWRIEYPGVETLKVAVMGCVVNGPGESQHADIGISLPGAFEEPLAPVFIDGQRVATLKGDKIKEEFLVLFEKYVADRFKDRSI